MEKAPSCPAPCGEGDGIKLSPNAAPHGVHISGVLWPLGYTGFYFFYRGLVLQDAAPWKIWEWRQRAPCPPPAPPGRIQVMLPWMPSPRYLQHPEPSSSSNHGHQNHPIWSRLNLNSSPWGSPRPHPLQPKPHADGTKKPKRVSSCKASASSDSTRCA